MLTITVESDGSENDKHHAAQIAYNTGCNVRVLAQSGDILYVAKTVSVDTTPGAEKGVVGLEVVAPATPDLPTPVFAGVEVQESSP